MVKRSPVGIWLQSDKLSHLFYSVLVITTYQVLIHSSSASPASCSILVYPAMRKVNMTLVFFTYLLLIMHEKCNLMQFVSLI